MNKQDKKSQRIADDYAKKQTQKVERSELGDMIAQIAKSLGKNLGTYTVRKVLACKILSVFHELSVTEWCIEAKIGRNSWYRIHLLPNFSVACVDQAKQIFGPKTIEVTQALIRKALYGSQDGMGDVAAQAKILQQVGVLDKPQVATGAQQTVTVVVQQERENKLERGMGRLGYCPKVEVLPSD